MQASQQNNKRIAKNTLLLYIRTLFVLFIKLFTSRLTLKYLGVEDYGIYNIVGSFVVMFTVFNGALTTSIQRFLTFSLGQKKYDEVQRIFSASMTTLLMLCAIIMLFAETIGLWYVNEHLEIPDGRMTVTNIIYQFSIITFIFEVITVPYNSILTAYEDFKAFAYFDILNAMLTLVLVASIPLIKSDALVYYGAGVLGIAVMIRLLYSFYCRKHYETSRFVIVKDKTLYKRLFSFSFYSFMGNMGSVIGEGGVNIVINLFFGVTINATRAISTQISNAVGGFARSFTTALSPQITKNYAESNRDGYTSLVISGAKFSFLLLAIFIVPILVNAQYILEIWLTVIPPFSEIFVQLMLIQSLIHILFNPITTIVNATGNIRSYQVGTFIILISNICFVYIVYSLGYPAYSGIIIQCVVYVIQLLYSMLIMEKITGISAIDFLKRSVIPSFFVFAICLAVAFGLRYCVSTLKYTHLLSLGLSFITTAIICLMLGFNSVQRNKILHTIKKKIKR